MRVALHGVPQRVPSRRWARENLQFAATIIADPLNAPLPRRFAILKHFGWLSHRRVLPIAGEPCRRSLSAERLTLFLPPLLAAPRAAFDLLIKVGDRFRLDYHRKEEGFLLLVHARCRLRQFDDRRATARQDDYTGSRSKLGGNTRSKCRYRAPDITCRASCCKGRTRHGAEPSARYPACSR